MSSALGRHAKRGAAFLVIGGVAFLVDALVFNVLVYGGQPGLMYAWPLGAKVISVVTASVATYLGNKWWTFRSRRTSASLRQLLIFSALNVVAIAIQLSCLAFSRYILHLADPISDNVSGTLIGQALATLFRYITYDRWVFPNQDNRP